MLRDDLLKRFAWVKGHADVWRLFSDGPLFARLVRALAEPFRDAGVTKVAGIEARGFIVGAAVANELGVGFVAIRKESGLLPGGKLVRRTAPDYRGNRTLLRIQRHVLTTGDRVLLVDDWAEVGSQATAARELIEEAGAELVGVSLIVDQLAPDARGALPNVHTLVHADELGPSA